MVATIAQPTARWSSETPLGFEAGDTNLRRYVGNSPPNATDPSGLYGIQVHFYTVYTVLRARGWEHDIAYRVAGWSQYVDDDTATAPVLGSSNSAIVWNSIRRAEGGNNFKNESLMKQFHFWGCASATATERDPDDLRKLVEEHVAEFDHAPSELTDRQRRNEARLGVLLHTYADTFAHEGFTAWHNSKINKRTGGMTPNRGHGDAAEGGHAPDNAYNDIDKALEAAEKMYSLFPRGPGKHVPWHVLEKDLRKTLDAVPQSLRGDDWDEKKNYAAQIAASQALIKKFFNKSVTYNKSDLSKYRAHFICEMQTELDRVKAPYDKSFLDE